MLFFVTSLFSYLQNTTTSRAFSSIKPLVRCRIFSLFSNESTTFDFPFTANKITPTVSYISSKVPYTRQGRVNLWNFNCHRYNNLQRLWNNRTWSYKISSSWWFWVLVCIWFCILNSFQHVLMIRTTYQGKLVHTNVWKGIFFHCFEIQTDEMWNHQNLSKKTSCNDIVSCLKQNKAKL